MARCMFFFDGFNLYHSLIADTIVNKKRVQKYKKYKWLDLYRLAQLFVKKSDSITEVDSVTEDLKVVDKLHPDFKFVKFT